MLSAAPELLESKAVVVMAANVVVSKAVEGYQLKSCSINSVVVVFAAMTIYHHHKKDIVLSIV